MFDARAEAEAHVARQRAEAMNDTRWNDPHWHAWLGSDRVLWIRTQR